MAEADKHSKTEEPTGKRREKFRKEGKIAQSRDLSAVVVLAAMLSLVVLFGGRLARHQLGLVRATIGRLDRMPGSDGQEMWSVLDVVGSKILATLAPLTLCACVLAIIASLAQTKGNISTENLGFKAEKLNVVKSLQQMLFSGSMLQQIGLSVAKAALLGLSLFFVLKAAMPKLVQIASLSLFAALSTVGRCLLQVTLVALALTGTLAVLDYWLNYRRLHQQMRMTKQEVKDEHKQSEGDPMVRQRMRAQMMKLGQNRMLADVASADVVVVNPTHYAVALAYDPLTDAAPRVVGKGKDLLAAKIRKVARKHQIPVVSNPPVARAIYAVGEVGEPVPAELYEMVAKIVAYLYRITGKVAA